MLKLYAMRLPKVGDTLFLKDLAESNTIEDIFESNYFDLPIQSFDVEYNRMMEISDREDKYTPVLVRGMGPNREGRCGIFQKWFKLKTISYWYHMNYKHGISAKGVKYPEPVYRDSKKEEGFCKICNQWIILGNSKKSGNFLWLRHLQKYHKK